MAAGMASDLHDLVLRFTEAFNRDDLDAVMALFAEDGIYDEFNGRRSRGKAAIRAAFEPQFRGDHGRIRFEPEDLFVDEAAGKALIRWTCTVGREGRVLEWRGLDVLHVKDGLVAEKHTYAKAERPLLATRG
jgi:ketosteroid isomerase-like protein